MGFRKQVKPDESESLRTIQQAIQSREPVSFGYRNSDGEFTTHNAVYPRRIFTSGNHRLFEAYCHFTTDVRVFRFDRARRLRLGRTYAPAGPLYWIGSFVFAVVVLISIFMVLILFSPKYRWRQVKEFLFERLGYRSALETAYESLTAAGADQWVRWPLSQ